MAKFRDKDTFTYAEVEGALCAWEHILDHHDKEPFKAFLEGYGYGAMRMVAVQAGAICDQTYKAMEAKGIEYTTAYDWEFVPMVLARLDWQALISDNQYGGEPYEPDVEVILTAMMQATLADFSGQAVPS